MLISLHKVSQNRHALGARLMAKISNFKLYARQFYYRVLLGENKELVPICEEEENSFSSSLLFCPLTTLDYSTVIFSVTLRNFITTGEKQITWTSFLTGFLSSFCPIHKLQDSLCFAWLYAYKQFTLCQYKQYSKISQSTLGCKLV